MNGVGSFWMFLLLVCTMTCLCGSLESANNTDVLFRSSSCGYMFLSNIMCWMSNEPLNRTNEHLLWSTVIRIVKDNGLADLILISDGKTLQESQGSISSSVALTRWSCDTQGWSGDLYIDNVPLVTVVVYCPEMDHFQLMEKVIDHLSRGGSGVLCRPAVNWLLLSESPPASFLSHLLSGADKLLHITFQYQGPGRKSVLVTSASAATLPDVNTYRHQFVWKGAGLPRLKGLLRPHFRGFDGHLLRVGTISDFPPFSYETDSGFQGITIDLLHTLGQALNFSVQVVGSVDGKFGGREADGRWNGLVGMLLRGDIDVIATGLTITGQRRQVIDFTASYWQESLGMILRVDDSEQWFSFIQPFQPIVWLCYWLSGAIVVVVTSLFFYLAMKITPTSMTHGRPHHGAFYVLGVILLQSGVLKLTHGSVRLVLGGLWLAAIVVAATYSGNLVASLSTERLRLPFTSLQGLVDQAVYMPVVKKGTSTMDLFKQSSAQLYSKAWDMMTSSPELLAPSPSKALEMVASRKVAFIGDATPLQNKALEDDTCRLFVLPDRFYPSGYGIALPKDSPFTKQFSEVISSVLEAGVDIPWFRRHWPEDRCSERLRTAARARPVVMTQVTGLFILLLAGLAAALLILLLEVALAPSLKHVRF